MLRTLVALAVFLSIPSVLAAEGLAQLTGGSGSIQFDGSPIEKGAVLSKEGLIETGNDGKAQLQLLPAKTMVFLGPSSKFHLKAAVAGKAQEVVLAAGTLRWTIPPELKKSGKSEFLLKTKSAVMGVRGTDFMGVYNPILNETELVVFDGEVALQSELDAKDRKNVSKGYWGGVGGRFGKKIGDLIKLPEDVLAGFNDSTTFKE